MTDLERMFDQYKEKINLQPDSEEKIQKTINAARQAFMESENTNSLKQPGRMNAFFEKMKTRKRLIPVAAILSICFIALVIASALDAAKPADSKQPPLPLAAASPKPEKPVMENDQPKTAIPAQTAMPAQTATPAQTAAPTLMPTTAPTESYSEYTLAQNNDPNTSSTYPNKAMKSDFNYCIYLDEISYTPEWDTTLNENITVDAQYVGENIGQTVMQKYTGEGEDFLDCDVFAIQNVSSRCAVACSPHAGNYQNTYILFIADTYSPGTWGEYKADLHLEENLMIAADQEQAVTLDDKLRAVGQYNGEYDAILQYLFHLPDAAVIDNNMDSLLDGPYWENTINESVNMKIYLKPFGTQGMRTGLTQMIVYDIGYLQTGWMGQSLWYYIGETAAQECIDMVKNNLVPLPSSEAYSGDEYMETNPN